MEFLVLCFPVFIMLSTMKTVNCTTACPVNSNASCGQGFNGAAVTVTNLTCLGVQLEYRRTPRNWPFWKDTEILDSFSDRGVSPPRTLAAWSNVLSGAPDCWNRMRALLCALYMPECDGFGQLLAPSKDMCVAVHYSCNEIITQLFGTLGIFECSRYRCSQPPSQLAFRTFRSATDCVKPLVSSSEQRAWLLPGLTGCALPCEPPFYTDNEYRAARVTLGTAATLLLCFNCFIIVTCILEWKFWSCYPLVMLFYAHCCMALACAAWLAGQVSYTTRRDVLCRRDGTPRRAEPQISAGESISCTLVFVLLYTPLCAAATWLLLLAYAARHGVRRYLLNERTSTVNSSLAHRGASFHIAAWSLSTVLSIICLTAGWVDADPLSGVCFVSASNPIARLLMVLVPFGLVIVVVLVLILPTLLHLRRLSRKQHFLKTYAQAEGGDVAMAELPALAAEECAVMGYRKKLYQSTVTRLGSYCFILAVVLLYVLAAHFEVMVKQSQWNDAISKSILCMMRHAAAYDEKQPAWIFDSPVCPLSTRPSAWRALLLSICFFVVNLSLIFWQAECRLLAPWRRLFLTIKHHLCPPASAPTFERAGSNSGGQGQEIGTAMLLMRPLDYTANSATGMSGSEIHPACSEWANWSATSSSCNVDNDGNWGLWELLVAPEDRLISIAEANRCGIVGAASAACKTSQMLYSNGAGATAFPAFQMHVRRHSRHSSEASVTAHTLHAAGHSQRRRRRSGSEQSRGSCRNSCSSVQSFHSSSSMRRRQELIYQAAVLQRAAWVLHRLSLQPSAPLIMPSTWQQCMEASGWHGSHLPEEMLARQVAAKAEAALAANHLQKNFCNSRCMRRTASAHVLRTQSAPSSSSGSVVEAAPSAAPITIEVPQVSKVAHLAPQQALHHSSDEFDSEEEVVSLAASASSDSPREEERISVDCEDKGSDAFCSEDEVESCGGSVLDEAVAADAAAASGLSNVAFED